MITQTIDLNMIPESAPVIVHVNQYDTGEGRLIVNLYNGEQSYTPASGATAKVQGTKPDKKGFSYDATISGSTVTVDIEEQMTCVAGRTRTNLIITEGERKTGTFVFWLEVQATGLADDVDISETMLPEYIDGAQRAAREATEAAATVGQARDEAVAARNEAVPAAQTATTKAAEASASASSASVNATAAEASAQRVEGEALTAEAWAVGTRNGEQIPSTDPAYNNHARYWAGQAEQFAQGGLIYKGSIAFANIPTSGMKVGDMYNITDDFITDSRFQEGAGKKIGAGTNIAWDFNSKWDVLAIGVAGHDIVNSSGTVMTARSKLKFMNSTVTDDSTNDTTIVTPTGSSVSYPISVANGGTGATSASGARSNLGLGSLATLSTVPVANGGTGATSASGARTNLGLGSLATKSSASLTSDVTGTLPIGNGGTGATSASGARSNLGLGSLATKSSVSLTSDVSGILPVANGGTGNSAGYIRTGQKSGTTIGSRATAEGDGTTASGNDSHAEGYMGTASGTASHVEGGRYEGLSGNVASGYAAHAEGTSVTASGGSSHAEGVESIASGERSHAGGSQTQALGECSFAHGNRSKASAFDACAFGEDTVSCANHCIAVGKNTRAGNNPDNTGQSSSDGEMAFAEGEGTIAKGITQHAGGHWNVASDGSYRGTSGNAFIIGNGYSSSRSNAFRVSFAGQVYGLSAFNSSGADYAEFFEWKDGNSNNEDRVGYFVTLDGEKIKIADKGDYVLGVISGQPSVIGNGDEDWLGRWQRDDFGRFIWGDIEIENSEGEKETIHTILPNPDYDSTQKYIERKDRKEWDYVGMLGNIAVRDDGTCEVNGFCTVADGGVATKAETGYRVIKRVSDNVVKIILK